ncbi:MAG: hypothetical protein ABMB14_18530 [Myxococcota bacterium]
MSLILALIACSGLSDPSTPGAIAATAKTPTVFTKTILSKPYTIDKKYASMRGPYGFDDVRLTDADKPELLWIVGYKTTVVDADSSGVMSQEFMCHANLDFEAKDYYDRFPTAPPVSGRVFTLSQGQQDIRFPEGFGIPVTSDLPISLATQVLNLNIDKPDGLHVRHKVDIYYVKDVDVQGEMVPLFQGAAEGFKALGEAKHYGFTPEEVAQMDAMGSGCSVGSPAISGDSDDDSVGQKFTAHWIVPPGKEVNVTNVTRFLNLPYDTTVHYIAVHLHPFAQRLVLKDLTADKIVFDAKVTPSPGRVGIDAVDHYSSVDGMPMYKSHQYELTSYYDNTSDHEVDSMAVMYMYMRDKNFEKPDLTARAATPAPEPAGDKKPKM